MANQKPYNKIKVFVSFNCCSICRSCYAGKQLGKERSEQILKDPKQSFNETLKTPKKTIITVTVIVIIIILLITLVLGTMHIIRDSIYTTMKTS
ncbi:hypothetical protein C5G87_01640 [Paenibacillus peoriae]|nr:hypothetical protein C5G87_01640 [Paenibacillus peoriae]